MDLKKPEVSQEMLEVFSRAESVAKLVDKAEINVSILFLAMLSCPNSQAYKTLEQEGYNPLQLYNTVLSQTKRTKGDSVDSGTIIEYSQDLKVLMDNLEKYVTETGRYVIDSSDALFLMRSTKDSRIVKFLRVQRNQEKKEPGEDLYDVPKELYQYGNNLNKLAHLQKLDPIMCRDTEILRVMSVLERRTRNNPCLVGEPGVGKTAIIEGLAQKIVAKEASEYLNTQIIFGLDVPSIVAGCKYRGDFENRIKDIINLVLRAKNIILFIDEFHLVIGAGGEEGSIDASNILKPYIDRGGLKIIGATTITEYKKRVEKDPALERRLQKIIIEEPSIENATIMLQSLKKRFSEHHKGIEIPDEVLKTIVYLAARYITDKKLPDKAVDLLDESCVFARFNKKTTLTEEDVMQVLSNITKIPVHKLSESEADKLINLEKILQKDIISQEEPIKKVSEYIRRSRANLGDPQKPIGSFLFAGPSGVGKTYLCKILAKTLFNDEDAIIRLDMSEYMEQHSVSKLIGSPPGYVGFEDGGQLTDMVRNKPYSIILFDEIEKADTNVFNILLQILDEGRLTDSKGRVVDFKNTIIVLTSNLGSDLAAIQKGYNFGFGSKDDIDQIKELNSNVMAAIKKQFRPEFINRLDEIIIFNPLTQEDIGKILSLIIKEFKGKLPQINFDFTKEIVDYLSKKGYNKEYGARPLKRLFQEKIENPLAMKIIAKEITNNDAVSVELQDDNVVFRKD